MLPGELHGGIARWVEALGIVRPVNVSKSVEYGEVSERGPSRTAAGTVRNCLWKIGRLHMVEAAAGRGRPALRQGL